MSNDDDEFDALARHASQPDSSSFRTKVGDRAGPMFDQSVIAKMVAAIEATILAMALGSNIAPARSSALVRNEELSG